MFPLDQVKPHRTRAAQSLPQGPRERQRASAVAPPGKVVPFLALICILSGSLGLFAVLAQGPAHSVYLPQVSGGYRVLLPHTISDPSSVPFDSRDAAPAVAPAPPPSQVGDAGRAPAGFVARNGDHFELDGRPWAFVGVNVSYLAGPFFPEDQMEPVIAYLAGAGVQVIRVWVQPWCRVERVERMLDLGGQYGLRFILTLQDFYGQESGDWFRTQYATVDLPHIRSLVPRLAGRPEVLMWELMNEPTCPVADAGADCWDAVFAWAQAASREVKRLDPNHLVAIGTQRAGFDAHAIDTFARMQALESIDAVSVHCQAEKIAQGELKQELAIARELDKPIYLGEVTMRGLQENCQPLPGDALEVRARAIAAAWAAARQEGADGFMLWQYACRVDTAPQATRYFCGVYDYWAGDPVWAVLLNAQAAQ